MLKSVLGLDTHDFSFNLDGLEHAIVAAVQSAIEIIMPNILLDNNFQTRNGYGQFRWNAIITRLHETCDQLGWVDFNTCSRGAWKTPVLFHPASGYLVTFMTEETFKTTQHRRDKGRHYLCGVASLNSNVTAEEDQLKLELPGVSTSTNTWVAKSREDFINSVNATDNDVKGHILVLFEAHADKLLKIRAVRITPTLEISTEAEDWTRYIGIPYNTHQKIEPQNNHIDDEDERFVELID